MMMNLLYSLAAASTVFMVLGIGGWFIETTPGKRFVDRIVELLER